MKVLPSGAIVVDITPSLVTFTDMDVTGFFWLAANIGRLTLLLAFLICAGTALSYWLRSSRVR